MPDEFIHSSGITPSTLWPKFMYNFEFEDEKDYLLFTLKWK